jgi:thiol-disulfide isomerase/thioredoxin
MKNLKSKVGNALGLTWLICLALLLGSFTSLAKETPSNAATKAAERLKGGFDDLKQLDAAAKDAEEAGVPVQTIAEAKLVFYCANNVMDRLPDLIKQVEAMLPTWKESDSLFFQTSDELQGVISFADALVAENAKDESAFENAIKKAFWRNPKLAKACQTEIESHRAKERQAKLVLPLDLAIPLSNGGQTSLAELAKNHKAVLLDFWASWCGPCMLLMDDLRNRAHKLASSNIAVAGINTEAAGEEGSVAKAKLKAESVRKTKKMDLPWLIEPADGQLSTLLEIDSIPRAVLISPEGNVLYNGHPSDPGLTVALAKLDPRLTTNN